jgi:hypothetical protein
VLRTPTFLSNLPANTNYPIGILTRVIAAGQQRGELRAGQSKEHGRRFLILPQLSITSTASGPECRFSTFSIPREPPLAWRRRSLRAEATARPRGASFLDDSTVVLRGAWVRRASAALPIPRPSQGTAGRGKRLPPGRRGRSQGTVPSQLGYLRCMKAAAIVLCIIAIAAMTAAVRDIVLDTGSGRRGSILRAIALVAFLLAVFLNAAAG